VKDRDIRTGMGANRLPTIHENIIKVDLYTSKSKAKISKLWYFMLSE
jgi:hypothetical protein